MTLAEYRKEVWLLLHNSESSENETAAVRLYMDESGTRDTSKAVVGGILINYSDFLGFESAWDKMLVEHGIVAPLHMKEFGKHRRFGSMSERCRRELFYEVAGVVRQNVARATLQRLLSTWRNAFGLDSRLIGGGRELLPESVDGQKAAPRL